MYNSNDGNVLYLLTLFAEMEFDMATLRKRSNGSYEIKVSCGYGVDGKQRAQYKTWRPDPNMTPKQVEK